MLNIEIENLYSELNGVKEILDNKLNELKIQGISNDNLFFIKGVFKKTLEKENLNYIENNKKINNKNFINKFF